MAQEQSFNLGPSPAKKAKQPEDLLQFDNVCIICWKKEKSANLVTPKEEGKQKLFNTLTQSGDSVFYRVKSNNGFVSDEEGNISGFGNITIRYHRKCYQNYTSARNVSFRQFRENEPSEGTSAEEPIVRTRKSTVAFDKTKCIFCDCVKRKGDNTLYNVSTLELAQTICEIASKINDYDLSTKVLQQDLIALEAKYHRNCLSAHKRRADRTDKQTESSPKPLDPYVEAFRELMNETEDDIRMGKAYEITALRIQYEKYLKTFGITSYRNEKLKKRLTNYFGGKLTFHKPTGANQSELVYSKEIDIRTTINKIADMKSKLKDEEVEEDLFSEVQESDYLTLANAAILIRSAVKEVHGIATDRTIDKNDITEVKAKEMIPEILFRFIAALLGGKLAGDIVKDSDNMDKCMEKRIISLCQDIIYTVKKSRVKTPKHIGLSMSVKHLTGSKQLVNMLHSQGHCLSYDDLCRVESSIASDTLQLAEESGGVYIPTNMVAGGPFVHAAMDNIDINEETRSGEGTTHVLGGLLYQEKSDEVTGTFGPLPGRRTSRREKSVDTLSCLEILDCPNQYRKNLSLQHLINKVDPHEWFSSSNKSLNLDKAIIFARMCPTKVLTLEFETMSPPEQCITSWAGVHAAIQLQQEIKLTNIGYNPVIQGLPTDMNTIYTGIKIVEKQTRMLGQNTPVITFDLQLYIIAQEVRLKNWSELSHVVLRMGGFHILELYWKIMGKRYSFSGFEDILTEAEVFGPNAMTHIMQGGNYKRCTLAHKLMYEVMCRMQFRAFLSWLQDKNLMSEENAEKLVEKCESVKDLFKVIVQEKDSSDENCSKVESELNELHDMLKQREQEFQEFIADGQRTSNTFSLWNQYIEDIQIALDYIAAEKIPSWDQHLKSFHSF